MNKKPIFNCLTPRQLKQLSLVRKILDDQDYAVRDIFEQYISEKKINFNGMSDWAPDYHGILFTGTDGCRGCYDTKNLFIPYRYFVNFENAIQSDQDEAKRIRLEQEKIHHESIRIMREANERKLYEQLKTKYETR